MPPDFNEEKKLWKKGYKRVACIDEVGRGALCGPVVAAAVVVLIQNTKYKILNTKIRDSKQLSPQKRENFYKLLTEYPYIKWGLGRVSEKVIDKINILEATKVAMEKAIKNLEKKLRKQKYHNFYDRRKRSIVKEDKSSSSPFAAARVIDFLILDGKMKIDIDIPQKSIVKADEKVFSCAAASIIAKVTRDRLMEKYAKKFPAYGFERHKGYATKLHLAKLKKYGSCEIHRKSFRPIKTCPVIQLGLALRREGFLKENPVQDDILGL